MIIIPSSGNIAKSSLWGVTEIWALGFSMWAQQFVSQRGKLQKSDRHRNWIEVEIAFYHFGWEGWRIVTAWMTARLTWSSSVYPDAPGYHTPKQITASISLNRQMYLEMRLWVTQKGERLFWKALTSLGFLFKSVLLQWLQKFYSVQ